jgi:hypothetical protein
MWRSPQNVKGGTLAVAGILLAAAVARLVLPERRAGMLASRRRLADVAAFTVLGVALLVAGLVFPAQRLSGYGAAPIASRSVSSATATARA